MNFRSESRRRPDASLDLTPLIDAIFLLLIFFIVTATFSQQQDQSVVPVDLPTGSSGDAATDQQRATIFLERDGSYSIRVGEAAPMTALSRGELEEQLRTLHGNNPETALYLRGDREARYGDVMRLLDVAREIGFRRVFNVIQPAEN